MHAPIHTPPSQTHGLEHTHAHMQTFFFEHAMFVRLQALKLCVVFKKS